ncbi:Na-K-Cl cotransporter [bacterium]|nr:Na-K-Cl cotransporter [bacterium]
MYLRFGWVVGQVGLFGTFTIVTLSTAITFLTGLSIASIATDQKIKTGGAYYMISRSLGIEAGGAVGIPLYIAQALSVALYTIGFAESVVRVFPSMDEKMIALITTALITLVAIKSARAAIKTQFVIMAAIGLSLISLIFGGPVEGATVAVAAAPESSVGFWVVFAVFFPAVTGIMAGVNMSGDLENPSKSIPLGTLAAIGTGYLIYMIIPLILSSRATPEQLIADPLIMRKISFWGDAIIMGVWGATLSSALGSILGAPRVLQAIARDGVIPKFMRFLGQGVGPDDEPRMGTAFTFALAIITVLLADLDMIAPVLTMFFLTTYGVLNITAALEGFLGNPSFRPKFRVHWLFSLAGAVGCTMVMFLINPLATGAAIAIVIVIYFWLERQELRSAWGDVRSGIWFNLTRTGLLRLRSNADAKNWRPHLLVLSGAPTKRWHLIEFASSLSHNRGLLTVSSVLSGENITASRIEKMTQGIYDYMDKQGIQALVRIIKSKDPFGGATQLVDTYGLGTLVPNTVVLGSSEESEHHQAYCHMISRFYAAKRNAIIIRHNEQRGFGSRRHIDVWWGGLKGNGALMMILSWLLSTSLEWRGATVTIKMVVPTAQASDGARSNLEEIILSTRTGAQMEVLVSDGRSFWDVLQASSATADLIFLGMAPPDNQFASYYPQLLERTAGLPSTVFVLAGEDLEFGDVIT